MKLQEALKAAIPTNTGDRFAIAQPFPDVTFVAALWGPNASTVPHLRVRGYHHDMVTRDVIKAWEVEDPEAMTIEFRPMA